MKQKKHKKSRRGRQRQPDRPPDDTPPGRAAPPLSLHVLARGDLLHAAGVLVASLALYAFTACPTPGVGDSGELAAAAATFGVAHPPGYPLYTLLTGLGVRALWFLEPAHAANILSGLYGACGVGLLWLLLRRLAPGRLACWFGAASFALGNTFWAQATLAEVYTFDILVLLVLLHGTAQLARRPNLAWCFWCGLLLGLWVGHRLNNLVYLPAPLLLYVALGGRRLWGRQVLVGVGGLIAAALPLAYLPLASARDPLVDMGDPQSWERFWAVISAAPFRGLLGGVAADVALRRVALAASSLPLESGLAALTAVVGVVNLWRRGRPGRLLVAGLAAMLAASVGFVALYDILDYDAYLLPGLVALALLGGIGAGALLEQIADSPRPWIKRAGPAAVLCCALVGLPLSFAARDQHRQTVVGDLASDILASLPPDALLLVQGDTTSGAIDYLQAVQRRAPSVVVVRVENLVPWYVDHLARRFPGDPWPALAPGEAPGNHALRIIEALGKKRAVYLTLSVDPRALFAKDSPYGLVPNGLVQELRRKGERITLARRAMNNAARLRRRVERLQPPGQRADLDLRSLYLQYGLALFNTATQLRRSGLRRQAHHCLQSLLEMKPNRQDQQLRQDVMVRSGRTVPTLRLEQRARAQQALLERRARPKK